MDFIFLLCLYERKINALRHPKRLAQSNLRDKTLYKESYLQRPDIDIKFIFTIYCLFSRSKAPSKVPRKGNTFRKLLTKESPGTECTTA